MSKKPVIWITVLLSLAGCATQYYPDNTPTYFEIALQQTEPISIGIVDFRPFILNFGRYHSGQGVVYPYNYFGFANAYNAVSTQLPLVLSPLGPPVFLTTGIQGVLESSITHNKINATVSAYFPIPFKPTDSSLLLSDQVSSAESWAATQNTPERIARQIEITSKADPQGKIRMAILLNDFVYQNAIGFAPEKESNGFHYDVDVIVVDAEKHLLSRRAFRGLALPPADFAKKAASPDIFFFCADVLLKRIFTDAGILGALGGSKDPGAYETLSLEDKSKRLKELVRLKLIDEKFATPFLPP